MIARLLTALIATFAVSLSASLAASPGTEPGLLFRLSGDMGPVADFAANGVPEPTFCSEVSGIPDGAFGKALRCGDLQKLAYLAPGNIYAQRGTLSFFWRTREPVGPTEFPVFRVGYGDHSSWDMVWLRIDYNGHGFDAFVTDASLARVRVSASLVPFPAPDRWVHLALTWDERLGIRFFVGGKLVAENLTPALLDAALDQFGPHSRIISPYQVQSDYNFVRGGDLDELRIYDHALSDAEIALLSEGKGVSTASAAQARTLDDESVRREWWWRFGWNRPDDPPPALTAPRVSVRKVEILEAYDLKRWWWKATDGIRETTWPGVYNRSRLPGRNDYFKLPDWDCYSLSGRAITFELPKEPWNHVEIGGAADGRLLLVRERSAETSGRLLAERPDGQEKTVHRLPKPVSGGFLRFENNKQETPIGELGVYLVTAGSEPQGHSRMAFRLAQGDPQSASSLASLWRFVTGRHPADERALLIGYPASASVSGAEPAVAPVAGGTLPFVNVLLPDLWADTTDGLDGLAIDLPALRMPPTHGSLLPLNIQVKDPLWPMRNLCDFTFSLEQGKPVTLWLDLRDRLLPKGRGLYLTIAAAGKEFGAATLSGTEVRMIFKPRQDALKEHEEDRFTQARDSYAMLVEERPKGPKYNLWNRFEGDIQDLLRADPEHELGRLYWAAANPAAPKPKTQLSSVPEGVPAWAYRQSQLLREVGRFVDYYIDERQIENGEFGGGISDDTDLTNQWPGVALMGWKPEKLASSVERLLDAAFENGMFTNGLSTIQTDELHSYEEGINAIGEVLLLRHGSPRQFERAMATAKAMERITGVNAAGHRHFRSSYFSGTKMATEGVWGWSKAYNYLILQPSVFVADYNGNSGAKKLLLEMVDGLLAHRHQSENGRWFVASSVHFETDAEARSTRPYLPYGLFFQAWLWTGEERYLAPIRDLLPYSLSQLGPDVLNRLGLRSSWTALAEDGARRSLSPTNLGTGKRGSDPRGASESELFFEWQAKGDLKTLTSLYEAQLVNCLQTEYINTKGSLWIDRVGVPTAELQRSRLGGIALVRNGIVPGHMVSWAFRSPDEPTSLGILTPIALPDRISMTVYNLEKHSVGAELTGWGIDPGVWELEQSVDADQDGKPDAAPEKRSLRWERSGSLSLSFAPRTTTLLEFRLKERGTPYWNRPDLGLDRRDARLAEPGKLMVTVHGLGSVASPVTRIECRSASGKTLGSAEIPRLEAPQDLLPRTVEVAVPLPEGAELNGATVVIDPDARLEETTRLNNKIAL